VTCAATDESKVWREWSRWYDGVPPLSHLLRVSFPDRWLRIHNFSGRQRIPRSTRDNEEVLKRNRGAATAVLEVGSKCVGFLASYGNGGAPRRYDECSWLPSPPQPKWRVDPDWVEELSEANFLVARFTWAPQCMDEVILYAARDEIGPVIVLSLLTGGGYSPYDGGADLFVAEPGAVPVVRAQLSRWVSKLPSGL